MNSCFLVIIRNLLTYYRMSKAEEDQLVEMGFELAKVKIALKRGFTVEGAINLLFSGEALDDSPPPSPPPKYTDASLLTRHAYLLRKPSVTFGPSTTTSDTQLIPMPLPESPPTVIHSNRENAPPRLNVIPVGVNTSPG